MAEPLPDQARTSSTSNDAAAGGDAMSRLFIEHNRALVSFLRLRVGSDHEARDIAQEAYVRLLQLNEQGAVSFLRAYLFKIASNLATDRMRGQSVRRAAHADPFFTRGEDEVTPDRGICAQQQLDIITLALQDLPEDLRTAFVLRRLDGLSSKEIGARLGVTERTAHNYIVKAMIHCRLKLADGEASGPGDEA